MKMIVYKLSLPYPLPHASNKTVYKTIDLGKIHPRRTPQETKEKLMSVIKISPTAISAFLECPFAQWVKLQKDTPDITNPPILGGKEIHSHVQFMETGSRAEPRRFVFKSCKSALGGWKNRWDRAVDKIRQSERVQLIGGTKDALSKIEQVGYVCTANYWNANFSLPPPIAVEKALRYNLPGQGVKLIGKVDLIREASVPWISRHRPELVVDGKLADDYDPVVIIDIKTGFLSYDAERVKDSPTTEDWVRLQYQLHEDVQASMYLLLYELLNGKKPVGFMWYHLRSGKLFFTYRTRRQYLDLLHIINHVVDNMRAQSFPKNPGRNCRFCRYLKFCKGEEQLLISKPEEMPEVDLQTATIEELTTSVVRRKDSKQPRLLSFPRTKKEAPTSVPATVLHPEPRVLTLPAESPSDDEEDRGVGKDIPL